MFRFLFFLDLIVEFGFEFPLYFFRFTFQLLKLLRILQVGQSDLNKQVMVLMFWALLAVRIAAKQCFRKYCLPP